MKTKNDPMGDRLKKYEEIETSRYCDPTKPICARLDGRAFHTFTSNLQKPYDTGLSSLMVETTKFLVKETHPKIGYTQSDEITLIYNYEGESQPLFGGKIHKLTSLLAGMCSAKFVKIMNNYLPDTKIIPCFDARVFQTPSKEEAANVVLWRWFDARKNSVSMLAQSVFSHKDLQNKDTKIMKEMLLAKGYDWETYPDFFKWGTFIQRKKKFIQMEEQQLECLTQRSYIEKIEMPLFSKITNRVGVIFDGEEPLI